MRQQGQVLGRIGPVQLAGVDQAQVQIAHRGSVTRLEEHVKDRPCPFPNPLLRGCIDQELQICH